MNRHEQIQQRKQGMGTRSGRKQEKYSNGFNENFKFFFLLSRTGLIDFCGERITIVQSENKKMTSRHCFKLFEDGQYSSGKLIESCQPNIFRHVLMGKKGWGLWSKEWSMGIASGEFTKQEILDEFEQRNISIPDCFMNEFENRIRQTLIKQIQNGRTP